MASPPAVGESKLWAPFEDPWTKAKIIDRFQSELARAHEYVVNEEFGHTLIVAKYYEKADYLMHRIPLYKPAPTFDIDLNDLSPNVKHELVELKRVDPTGFNYVQKMAVDHIFENIDFDYFHRSVMRHLKIRIVEGGE